MNYIIRIEVKPNGYIDAKRDPLYIVNDYFSDDSLLSEIITKKFSRAHIFRDRDHVEQYKRNHLRRLFPEIDAKIDHTVTILELTDEELFLSRLKEEK